MAICLNHTDREATTRCATCFKPLCAECAKPARGQVFCSERCQQNYAASEERLAAVAARDRANARRQMVERLIILLVVILAAVAAVVLLKKNPTMADKLKRNAELLKDKAAEGARDVGQKLNT